MKLLKARVSTNAKPKVVELEAIEKKLVDGEDNFFYFDRENEHKDLNEMLEHFENQGKNILMKEVKYGLGDLDYMYEVHIY